MQKSVVTLTICTALMSGCVTTNSTKGLRSDESSNSGKVAVGDTEVHWAVDEALGTDEAGNTLAFFTFTNRTGDSVTAANVTTEEASGLAQSAIEAHPNCNWVGFDPAVNAANAGKFGTAETVIVAPVSC